MKQEIIDTMTEINNTMTMTKSDFICNVKDGEWVITEDNCFYDLDFIEQFDLKQLEESGIDGRIKDSILTDCPSNAPTVRLRRYCNRNFPEIDFDEEFQTNEPGVFQRFLEKMGGDILENIQLEIYKELMEKLKEKGYFLTFSKD